MTYEARHLALGGDTEPEGLASTWGDGPAPRHAMPQEETATSYEAYAPEPQLLPFTAVAPQDLPGQATIPSEFGRPVVAPVPSQTMQWHLAAASMAPVDPGPVNATRPVTIEGPIDPASYPTPVSHFATVSYQSMASPTYGSVISPRPYPSVPAQGGLGAPLATPYAGPATHPYGGPVTGSSTQGEPQAFGAVDGVSPEALAVAGAAVVKVAVTVQRVASFVVLAVVLSMFTAAGISVGGQSWWIVGIAWVMGIVMLIAILAPGRGRLRWSALK